YIQKSFSNKDLDVTLICEHLHISASYFSKLFKTETKETIVEYITRIRMEKSKELLKSSAMKVFEISQVVGYEDQHYFSYNFRKQTGMTPTEYRKSEAVTID
ncbi:MAG: helix-turn-helix transcriptional regulator, partial [Vallitaleaceae bacterium]|nr:helix-turn-helix transcriptional regulator [Vallitaleaceae bacterium]